MKYARVTTFLKNPCGSFYLDMDGVELTAYLNGIEQNEKREIEKIDYLNYMLGQCVVYSWHDPKHYPKAPFTHNQRQEVKGQTVEHQVEVLKLWMQALGGKETNY